MTLLMKIFKVAWPFILFGILVAAIVQGVNDHQRLVKERDDSKKAAQVARDELDAYRVLQGKINAAQDSNDRNTTTVIERTNQVEKQINALPKTTDCVESPAVMESLRVLQARSENSNTPATK